IPVPPHSPVIGPAGGGAGACRGCGGALERSRACRPALRPPPPSMTTRRFRPPGPWRGRIGRVGPFRPPAIAVQSRPAEPSGPLPALLLPLDGVLDDRCDLELGLEIGGFLGLL